MAPTADTWEQLIVPFFLLLGVEVASWQVTRFANFSDCESRPLTRTAARHHFHAPARSPPPRPLPHPPIHPSFGAPQLVLDDGPINLWVGSIWVQGRLRAGSDQCRIGAPIGLTFFEAPGVSPPDMGIQVIKSWY